MTELGKADQLYRIANHIASAKGELPDEWQPWADEIESDLRILVSQERDNREPVAIVDIQSGRSDGNKLAIVFTRAVHALPDDVYSLYTAPPAPVVTKECPAAIRDLMASHSDDLFDDADAQQIWDACRAAMLKGGQP